MEAFFETVFNTINLCDYCIFFVNFIGNFSKLILIDYVIKIIRKYFLFFIIVINIFRYSKLEFLELIQNKLSRQLVQMYNLLHQPFLVHKQNLCENCHSQ